MTSLFCDPPTQIAASKSHAIHSSTTTTGSESETSYFTCNSDVNTPRPGPVGDKARDSLLLRLTPKPSRIVDQTAHSSASASASALPAPDTTTPMHAPPMPHRRYATNDSMSTVRTRTHSYHRVSDTSPGDTSSERGGNGSSDDPASPPTPGVVVPYTGTPAAAPCRIPRFVGSKPVSTGASSSSVPVFRRSRGSGVSAASSAIISGKGSGITAREGGGVGGGGHRGRRASSSTFGTRTRRGSSGATRPVSEDIIPQGEWKRLFL